MLFDYCQDKFSLNGNAAYSRTITGLIGVLPLARIFHTSSAAVAQSRLSADFSSVGLLDVVSTTPAQPSVGKVTIQATLSHLATNKYEICELAMAKPGIILIHPARNPPVVPGVVSGISGDDLRGGRIEGGRKSFPEAIRI